MKKLTIAALLVSHLLVGAVGFGLGIYVLPILIAPEAPTMAEVNKISESASYSGMFSRDRQDSDAFHWGEGNVYVGKQAVTLMGELAPGPDYRLYLSKEFVETEEKFKQLKPDMVMIGGVNTFENFVVDMPSDIDPSQYTTVIVWCERFSEFISSARYQ